MWKEYTLAFTRFGDLAYNIAQFLKFLTLCATAFKINMYILNIYVYAYIHTYILQIYLYIYIYIIVYIYMCVCVCVCLCVYVYVAFVYECRETNSKSIGILSKKKESHSRLMICTSR